MVVVAMSELVRCAKLRARETKQLRPASGSASFTTGARQILAKDSVKGWSRFPFSLTGFTLSMNQKAEAEEDKKNNLGPLIDSTRKAWTGELLHWNVRCR